MNTELPNKKGITKGKDTSRSCSFATSQSSSLPRNLAISFILLRQNIVSPEKQKDEITSESVVDFYCSGSPVKGVFPISM